MVARTLARMVLLRLGRSPTAVVGGLLLVGLCPLLSHWSPLSGLEPRSVAGELVQSWSLPVALAGVLLGLGILGRSQAFLARIPLRSRFSGEVAGLFAAALAPQASLLLGAVLVAGPRHALAGPAALAGILACDLHLALVGAWWLRVPLRPSVRAVFFPLLVWITPAFLVDGGWGPAILRSLLDPAQHLRAFENRGMPALLGLGPLLALLVAAWLLSSPRRPRLPLRS